MTNPNTFIDVHTFDGQWSHNITTRFDKHEKVIFFNWLIIYAKTLPPEILSSLDMHSSVMGLRLVIENTQSSSNFDPINKVYADDILSEICDKLVASDDQELRQDAVRGILEQMSDMFKLGQCPQGRSSRLIQIYKTLM